MKIKRYRTTTTLKNREFAAWLRRDAGAFFTDRAEEEEAATFVEEYNNKRLPAEFYEEGHHRKWEEVKMDRAFG